MTLPLLSPLPPLLRPVIVLKIWTVMRQTLAISLCKTPLSSLTLASHNITVDLDLDLMLSAAKVKLALGLGVDPLNLALVLVVAVEAHLLARAQPNS